jgi:4-alpha-glucanotransferase
VSQSEPPRRSGVLLHPSALPGSGTFGAAARQFVDWLASGGFSVWQVLPLGPVGADRSPYWSRADGAFDASFVDWREAVSPDHDATAFRQFCDEQREWLDDYALFDAISIERQRQPWWLWPGPLRDRDAKAIGLAKQRHSDAIARTRVEQWTAATQWARLKRYANERGVQLFGDLPIYVAPDSATVWSHREQFQLDANGGAMAVAGVPPDYFSADGQRWGNPLYDWQQAQRDGFAFWRARVARLWEQFDLVRIDHFRGLCAYWSVPASSPTARDGQWQQAPGRELLQALKSDKGALPLVAEDLGVITDDVVALRRDFNLPGMRVLQFGFDGNGRNPHLPHEYGRDTVAFSGTHDNDTTLGWYRLLDTATRERVDEYLGAHVTSMPGALLRSLLTSVAPLAVIPLADILQLGSEARFNVPGVASGNWQWRASEGALQPALADHWRRWNHLSGRSST